MLCVAVMLSVMVMGAGAAFSDQDKIENKEAVDMCAALNIIGGYPDGSYKPAGNIKRSEICKMICVALNGGEEPTLGTPATPTFSDVRNTPTLLGRRSTLSPACPRASCPAWAAAGSAPTAM
ncbi:MAG: S-layer homology domain-containing protein [Evtepia gabavorous]